MSGERPLGITIVCIFGFLISILFLLVAGLAVFIGIDSGVLANIPLPINPEILAQFNIGGEYIVGGLIMLFPILNLLFWWLLWKMNIIAWLILVASYGFSTYIAISNGALPLAVFPGIILLYLLLHTKNFLE